MKNIKSCLLLIFSAALIFSCSEEKIVYRDGVAFHFHNLNEKNHDRLCEAFLSALTDLRMMVELQSIKKIKVDSVPFGYLATIPYTDSITESAIDRLRGYATIVSSFHLENAPVHIALTEDNIVFKTLPFDPNAIKSIGFSVHSSQMSIESTYDCQACPLNGLSMVLSEKIPSLFHGHDTVNIKIKNEESLAVDIYINLDTSDLEAIKSEFSEIDGLYFIATFGRGNIHFRLRNKSDGTLRTVISI